MGRSAPQAGSSASRTVPVVDDPSVGLYPIRTVAHLTGVKAITLRAWEQRYGIVEPLRKASGHRLYTQAHVDRIHRVVSLLDRGMRVGDVRAFLDREVAERDPAEPTEELDQWQALLVRMQNAVMRFDEEALEAAYNEALAGHPVKTVMGRLVTPLLVEIGRRWARGEGSVAEEHFFAFYLRNKLGARFHHRSRNGRGPRLLMACLPGERHEIGLLLLALAANEAGYRPVILGADMPLEELAMAAEKTGSDAIILSGLMELPPELIKQDLPALVSAAAVPVLMGGSASVRCLDALRRCGIESLGADAETGLARLEQHIPINS